MDKPRSKVDKGQFLEEVSQQASEVSGQHIRRALRWAEQDVAGLPVYPDRSWELLESKVRQTHLAYSQAMLDLHLYAKNKLEKE